MTYFDEDTIQGHCPPTSCVNSNLTHTEGQPQKVAPLFNPSEEIRARLLSAQLLLTDLARVLPRKPCHRTLQRWAQAGMPYLIHPGSKQRLYRFQDVYQWLCSRAISRDIQQEAIDRSYTAFATKKSTRKTA